MLPIAYFPPTDPCCHGNEIWDKIGYNAACARDFGKILPLYGGFRGWAIECCQLHFPLNDPRCCDNEIRNKIGYNSACVRDICEIFCTYVGVFGNGPSNAANWILPRPPLVAMATKFYTKKGYTSASTTNITKVLASDGDAGWGFGN